jgi:hypothetical protein
MNEAVQRIWADLEAEGDETARGFVELTEEPALESESYLRAVAPLVRWLRVGYAAGHRRPSAAFYEVLFSRGSAAAQQVLDEYLAQSADARAEALPLWRALSTAARLARNRGFTTWDLDAWKPFGGDETKARMVAYIAPELDEKVRRLSFESKATISATVENALSAAVARYEAEHGELAVRAAVPA